MQARAGSRNVFQDPDFSSGRTAFIAPADPNECCAQVSFGFSPMMLHPLIIGTI
jgi:hypothetical protein